MRRWTAGRVVHGNGVAAVVERDDQTMRGTMRSSQAPAILVAVAALVAALAGTALAGPTASTSSSTKKTAKRALKKANRANEAALAAQDAANAAQGSANAAQGDADSAQGSADAAQSNAAAALGRSGRFSYSTGDTAATSTLFAGSGLLLQGHCLSGNLAVEAVSQADNSSIHVGVISDNDPKTGYAEDDVFDSGDSVPLKADHPAAENIQGTFTFRNGQNGKIVTSTYLLEEEVPLACNAFGTLAIQ